jgi:hypothetical protein
LVQGQGRAVIASSRADELSYAGKPYSAFTLALMEALCGKGVAQQDGYARMADLALHARQMVPRRTGDRQHPILNFQESDNLVVGGILSTAYCVAHVEYQANHRKARTSA